MSDISAYAAHAALVNLLGGSTFFALFKGDPELGAAEVLTNGTSYSRVPPASPWTITGRNAVNTANTDFPAASASWGTVTHVAIFDAAQGGNRLFSKQLTNPLAPNDGNVVRMPAGFPSITIP